jgi:short-subunit dehydrogenase
MKILVAGNSNYGLSEAIANTLPIGTEVVDGTVEVIDFISRSECGVDLTEVSNQKQFAKNSLNYDVTILVSCLWGFEQTKLAERIAKEWREVNHSGYLIALGSSADTPVKGTAWSYPVEKKALRAYCRQLSQMSAGENEYKLRVTYLSPGNMHTPKQDEKMPDTDKLNTLYVAHLIKFLINQPKDVNISELTLDCIPQ